MHLRPAALYPAMREIGIRVSSASRTAAEEIHDGGTAAPDPLIARTYERARSHLSDLTPREHTVLCLLAEGWTNGAITRILHVSDRTVESHVRSIYAKLGLDSRLVDRRVMAARAAFERGGHHADRVV